MGHIWIDILTQNQCSLIEQNRQPKNNTHTHTHSSSLWYVHDEISGVNLPGFPKKKLENVIC